MEETQLLILEFDYDSKANFTILPKVPGDIHDQHRSIGTVWGRILHHGFLNFFFFFTVTSILHLKFHIKKIKIKEQAEQFSWKIAVALIGGIQENERSLKRTRNQDLACC